MLLRTKSHVSGLNFLRIGRCAQDYSCSWFFCRIVFQAIGYPLSFFVGSGPGSLVILWIESVVSVDIGLPFCHNKDATQTTPLETCFDQRTLLFD